MVYLQQTLQTDYPFLANPFADVDLLTPFIETYWVEKDGFFKNDAQDDRVFLSADANVIPYWLGVVKDKKMHLASINAIRKEKLDQPFPLKYHAFLNSNWVHWGARIMIPNYQGDSIWTMMGPIYIEQQSEFYPSEARQHLETYIKLIEKYRTYVEVFAPDGRSPLRGRFGHDFETGMLWAAMIPPLIEKLGTK